MKTVTIWIKDKTPSINAMGRWITRHFFMADT
ncbi:MAG: hypothetical protein RLZZ519_2314, partial [Bacteroidota bacterium]